MHVFTHDRPLFLCFILKTFHRRVSHLHCCKQWKTHAFELLTLADDSKDLILLLKVFSFLSVQANFFFKKNTHTASIPNVNIVLKHFLKYIVLVLLYNVKKIEKLWLVELPFLDYIFLGHKNCPKRTVQFKLFRTSSKSSKMILCFWHTRFFFSRHVHFNSHIVKEYVRSHFSV